MTTTTTITLEQLGDVSVLRMDNGKANAMNPEMLIGLDGSLVQFLESDARSLVIIGYDRFFCAGLDLVTLSQLDREGMLGFMRLFQRVMLAFFWCPRPVVAAVNGHAVAGGCVLAMQADARIATDGKLKVGLNETVLGVGLPLVVAETLRTQLDPRVFASIAIEGQLYDGQTALDLGLLHERVAPDRVLDRALERSRELGAIPQAAFAQAKHVLRGPAHEAVLSVTAEQDDAWLDTWFGDEATALRDAVVAQLTTKA
jgi:enoyl-CoA hydratase